MNKWYSCTLLAEVLLFLPDACTTAALIFSLLYVQWVPFYYMCVGLRWRVLSFVTLRITDKYQCCWCLLCFSILKICISVSQYFFHILWFFSCGLLMRYCFFVLSWVFLYLLASGLINSGFCVIVFFSSNYSQKE